MSSDLIGQTLLNRYRVDSFVGRGGMAEVYKVWDMQRLTHLAMKVLREDIALDVVFLSRFRREARTLEKLRHPNIVSYYGIEQSDYLVFMLMDFIEGNTLKHLIYDYRERSVPLERILEVMRPVCSAIGFAHNQGLVHCDVKPVNIMLETNGRVLVTDFGIARTTDAATATMIGLGTPAYMAPEQVRGYDPVPQTDVYALGIVLYEMLTGGQRPFTGDHATITGSTGEKVRWEQVHFDPLSPRTYNPAISSDLEAVAMKCLAKATEDRFNTTIDLLNALELGIAGQSSPYVTPVPSMVKPAESAASSTPAASAAPPPVAKSDSPKKRRSFGSCACRSIGILLVIIGCLAAAALIIALISDYSY